MKKDLVIKFIRQGKNITQQQLADKVGINRAILSQIETGKILPTMDTLLEVARSLDCLITDLYKKEDLERIKK